MNALILFLFLVGWANITEGHPFVSPDAKFICWCQDETDSTRLNYLDINIIVANLMYLDFGLDDPAYFVYMFPLGNGEYAIVGLMTRDEAVDDAPMRIIQILDPSTGEYRTPEAGDKVFKFYESQKSPPNSREVPRAPLSYRAVT